MRRYLLLVLFLILVGCSFGGEVKNEELPEEQIPIANPAVEEPLGEAIPITATTELEAAPTLTNLGMAPELTNEIWLNSNQPLRLADLRGKVVLLEMWTFG